MTRSERPLPERNAGAFMGPDIMVPVPMGTLGDEPPAAGIDGDDRPRARPRRSWLHRLVDRLTMRPRA